MKAAPGLFPDCFVAWQIGLGRKARSELERNNVWDFYTGTLYNRLMPGGAIVVINHRMHRRSGVLRRSIAVDFP